MLIEFSHLCRKYGFIPKGIIHIGAHDLEELPAYISQGVSRTVWIEGNPDLVQKNLGKIDGEKHQLFHGLVYSEDGLDLEFKITNNSQSSSVLDFSKHEHYHPHVKFIESRVIKSITVKTLLQRNQISPGDFDFANLDIQGVEMKALMGFGEYMDNIKYIYTEVNSGEVYKGNDTIIDLDNYLSGLGFKRVETEMSPFEWGDAFYIR